MRIHRRSLLMSMAAIQFTAPARAFVRYLRGGDSALEHSSMRFGGIDPAKKRGFFSFNTSQATQGASLHLFASRDTQQPPLAQAGPYASSKVGEFNTVQGHVDLARLFDRFPANRRIFYGPSFTGDPKDVDAGKLQSFLLPPRIGAFDAHTDLVTCCGLLNSNCKVPLLPTMKDANAGTLFYLGDRSYGDNDEVNPDHHALLQNKPFLSDLAEAFGTMELLDILHNHDAGYGNIKWENASPMNVAGPTIKKATHAVYKAQRAGPPLWFPDDELCSSYTHRKGRVAYLVPDMICHRSETHSCIFGNDPEIFGVAHFDRLLAEIRRIDADPSVDFAWFMSSGTLIGDHYEAFSQIALPQYVRLLAAMAACSRVQWSFWEGDWHGNGYDDGRHTTMRWTEDRIRIPRFAASGILRKCLDPVGDFSWEGANDTYDATPAETIRSTMLRIDTPNYQNAHPRQRIRCYAMTARGYKGEAGGDAHPTVTYDLWSDSIPVALRWAATSLRVAANAVVSVDIAKSGHGPVGGCSVGITLDGASTRKAIKPNRALEAYTFTAPSRPGRYQLALSDPIGAKLDADTVLTLTVEG